MTQSSSAAAWAGRVASAGVVLFLIVDAAVDLFAPHLLEAELAATGFPSAMLRPLGLIVLVCALLYALPRTCVFGAILVTAFLGGAICTHFRLGEVGTPPQLICLAVGVLTWVGLYLRDVRVRALLPLTSRAQ